MTIHKRKRQGRNDVERGETRLTLKPSCLFPSQPIISAWNNFTFEPFPNQVMPVQFPTFSNDRAFSFTWPVAMQIFGTNYLTEKRV